MNTYWAALLLGLAGSLHCLGMCGPLALALPAGHETPPLQRALARLAYNLGRAFTYALMGCFAGLLGHVFQLGGFQRWVSILLGMLLIATLLFSAHTMPEWVLQTVYRPIQKRLGKRLRRQGASGLFHIGLLNGLLPCGLVYAALAGASLQEGPLRGAAYMFIFGLGTLPMMFALSMGGLSLRTPKFKPLYQYLVPALTLTAGVLLILRGLSLGIPYISPDLSTPGGCCPH